MESITNFRNNLIDICTSCPEDIGRWNNNGTEFQVAIKAEFEEFLRACFDLSLKTFITRLHLHGFENREDLDECYWIFSHPEFTKTTCDSHFATTEEVEELRNVIGSIRKTINNEFDLISQQINLVATAMLIKKRKQDMDEETLWNSAKKLHIETEMQTRHLVTRNKEIGIKMTAGGCGRELCLTKVRS